MLQGALTQVPVVSHGGVCLAAYPIIKCPTCEYYSQSEELLYKIYMHILVYFSESVELMYKICIDM
jgi:hypothetical protein